MMEQNTQQTDNSARRVFVYEGHRFDDPGAEYSVEQVQNHLVVYFPAVAHAAVEEKTLPDGTREITFRKQVARKGCATSVQDKLALLLSELANVAPYEDPSAEVRATLGSGPLSLAAIFNARETLQANADQVFAQADCTSRVVERCVRLPPAPLHGVPSGF
jgi:PRTRC genetic system protein C